MQAHAFENSLIRLHELGFLTWEVFVGEDELIGDSKVTRSRFTVKPGAELMVIERGTNLEIYEENAVIEIDGTAGRPTGVIFYRDGKGHRNPGNITVSMFASILKIFPRILPNASAAAETGTLAMHKRRKK